MVYLSQKNTKPGNKNDGLLARALFTMWDDGTTNLSEVLPMAKGVSKVGATDVMQSALIKSRIFEIQS